MLIVMYGLNYHQLDYEVMIINLTSNLVV